MTPETTTGPVTAPGPFDPPAPAVAAVVRAALAEDLGVLGDITTLACVDAGTIAGGGLVARGAGVVAGTAAVTEVWRQVDPAVDVEWHRGDGHEVEAGVAIGTVRGPLRSLLAGERVALNLLSHCSGVATLTRRFVRAAHGRTRVRDTRKTLPGLRSLQKAAVRAGGGFNHRDSLSDAVLVKDNHLAAIGVDRAVARARARWPGRVVEVECETLAQAVAAADAGADLVLVDNLSPDEVADVVGALGGRVPVEVSGGVTIETIGAYGAAGADYVAVGAITHSAPGLDVGLDLEVDGAGGARPDPDPDGG